MRMLVKIRSQKPERIAFFTALVSGTAVHMFALVNLLHNYDNILQQPRGYGAGITSGRWLLEVLGDFNDAFVKLNFNLYEQSNCPFSLYLLLIFSRPYLPSPSRGVPRLAIWTRIW